MIVTINHLEKSVAMLDLMLQNQFQIMRKFNEAIDEIRRNEVKQFRETNQQNILEHSHWLLLKRPENLAEKQTARMSGLLKLNLASINECLMREDFQRF
jgi:transposase